MRGDLLDLVLLAMAIGFGVSGYRQGFVLGVMSFVGFVGGCVFGVFVAPPVAAALVDGDLMQILVAVVVVLVAAILGQLVCSTLGAVVRSYVQEQQRARLLDAVGGTIAGVLSVLVISWMVGSLLVSSAFAPVVEQIRGSLLLSAVDHAMPDGVRAWQKPFKKFIDRSEFPPVLDAIRGDATVDVRAPDPAVLNAAGLQQARPGIVQVRGTARSCNKQIEGTGFVFAPDHVMTNAHVVAGVDTALQIIDHTGQSRPATVVRFNPRRDVAVLYVPNAGLPPLAFHGEAAKGGDAIVAGYPQGQGYAPSPARIAARKTAIIPDIYREVDVTRDVYLIRGLVRPGNSGGPLLTPGGQVLGVVFAAVTGQAETAYALTASEVSADARMAATATTPAGTRGCD
ncbi:MarP family serine protease [Nonomuraea sp. SMC257]|uniref:MarP family serine protease n=1 Tax=Nonomuraea montanisoli TaxID=2741721 RepID=A0A7Y6I605_9ACTN|nr:MarP family serine protease [Nonomuraea montanisoli]NUW32325.1 MarP family serine protease [Nonomuraea montanisoli]